MSKTTFLGYVPSLKAKHEATIVEGKAIESKGGSIRYTLRGEYEGRKTLPKTVSKADFESVYGFDAKAAEAVLMTGELEGVGKVNMFHMVGIEDENNFTPEKIVPIRTMNDYGKNKVIKEMKKLEADTVGSPSPASVEPPAPSEKPFPQEPSNENFSAEYTVEITGFTDGEPTRITGTEQELKDQLLDFHDIDSRLEMVDYYGFDEDDYEKAVKMLTEKWNEKSLKTICDNDDMLTLIETKEAFLGFGDDEEEEEPKEQEFTVVLQEGDKLELTDIEEDTEGDEDDSKDDNGDSNDSNDENEEGEDEEKESEYEAVSAKVTRPVKEEKEDEDTEGMSTLMKVGLVGGALAVGAAILGAEDEGESDYWAGENADWRAEGEGQIDMGKEDIEEEMTVITRHDHTWADYEWRTDKEVLTDEETDEVIEIVEEIVRDSHEEEDEQSFEQYDGRLQGDVSWVKHRDDGRFYGLAAEDFQKMTSSEFVPFDQITAEIQEEWDETTVPVAADYEPLNEPTNANFSAEDKRCSGCFEIVREGSINEACNGEMVCDECWNCAFCENCDACTDHQECECGCEVCGYTECECETKEAESNTMKWALGLTAIGVSLAALGYSDKMLSFFDRFKK
jgi:hypothetical protein